MTDSQAGYAEINGAQLYYEVAGSGAALTMVHAAIADHGMWDDQIAEFTKCYRVLRYDMRGYGQSEPVEGEFSHREDLLEILDTLGVEKTVLIGCSMGGTVCMDFAIQHPERVQALIMVGSSPSGFEASGPEAPEFDEIGQVWAAQNWSRFKELAVELWFDGQGRTPDQMDAKTRAHVVAMSGRAVDHLAKGLGKEKPSLQPSAVEQLDCLTIPTLIIYGNRDTRHIREAASTMERMMPNAHKILMTDTAHLPNMERPTEFNHHVLEFLQTVEVAG